MKISTKLRLSSFITIGSIFIFVSVAVFFIFSFDKAQQKQVLLQKITAASFQLPMLRDEYLAYPGERPKAQWVIVCETQVKTLDEATRLFLSDDERILLNDVKKNTKDIEILFHQLTASVERGERKVIIEELNNQMTLKSQARIFDVLRLSELSHTQMIHIERQFSLVIMVFGIVIVLISIIIHIMGRSIIRSLRTLGDDFALVAGLDFSTTAVTLNGGKNELNELAQSFNVMVGKLEESYKKVHDRTQDLEEAKILIDKKLQETERLNKVMVGRELKMVELKQEVKTLKENLQAIEDNRKYQSKS